MTNDVQTLVSEATGLLKSLIAIPSLSREEEQAADFLQNYIEMQGMATGRKGNNTRRLSPMFDLQKPTLLLNSHIDTVKPVNGWRKAPFNAVEENGKIYGLGSNDAGASVVGLLQVFLQLCRTTQAYNLIFLASCEEEVSGKGGIESVLPQLPPIQFAIVGEPTEMQPAIAEKGLMVLDVTAYGRSGHAARNEGDNAIYKVLDDIAWFRDYRFPERISLLGPGKDECHHGKCRNAAQCHPRPLHVCRRHPQQRMLYQSGAFRRDTETYLLRSQSPLVPPGLFTRFAGPPAGAEGRCFGTGALRLSHTVRPGTDAVPVHENGTGQKQPFTYCGRIYLCKRDRRSHYAVS